jgi:hypothetical protein
MACKCTQTTVNATAGGSTTAALSACTYPLWISMLSGCTAGLPATNTQSDVLISNPSANIVFNTGYPEGCNDSYTTCNQYVNNIGINETRPQHTLSIGGTLDVRDYVHFSRGDAASLTGGSKQSVYLGFNAGRTRMSNANSYGNTAVGYSSVGGAGVLNGSVYNTGIGTYALNDLTSGDKNTVIGANAGADITTGVNNTFLGTDVAYQSTSTGNRNVYLGYGQGYQTGNASDELRIGAAEAASWNRKPLIQGNFATSAMTVNGSLELEGTLTGFGDGNTGGNEYVSVVGGVYSTGVVRSPNLNFVEPAKSLYIGPTYVGHSGQTTDIQNTSIGYEAMSALGFAGDVFSNVAVGYRALYQAGLANAVSSSNTAVGNNALGVVANGTNNVAIGTNAIANAPNGTVDNVAIGVRSLFGATGAKSGNVSIGTSTLMELEGERYNTAVGQESLGTTASGSENTAIGFQAGAEVADASDFNVFIGAHAGQNGASANKGATFVGYGTATGATTSSSNIAIGYNAQIPYSENHFMNIGDIIYARKGFNGAFGPDTILLGRDAYTSGVGIATYTVGVVGALSATGAIHSTDYIKFPNVSESMCMGYQCGTGATTELRNTVIGYQSMGFLGSGSDAYDNTAVGYRTLRWTSNGGYRNTAIGSGALQFSNNGYESTAIGAKSLNAHTESQGNTSIGSRSMYWANNVEIENNTVVGAYAWYGAFGAVTTGKHNTIVGSFACQTANNLGDYNVYLGGYSNSNATATGKGNVFMGYGTATGATTNNDVILLGYNAQPGAAVDHHMNLGDVIYASPGSTNGSSGRKAVGINVPTPLTALDVKYDNVISLASDKGGGSDIVTFGSAGVGYAANTLVQLRGTDNWVKADADHTTLQGNLIGIAMGAAPEAGILLKGYYNVTTADDITTWANGGPVYVSTSAGKVTESIATHGAGDYIRLMGYMTTTANIIYFNPDNTFVVL